MNPFAPSTPSKPARITTWVFRIAVGLAMVFMGALPKLTGDATSMELFEMLGQPWARIPVGLAELVGAVLLLVPRTVFIGAAVVAGTMLGAIASHVAGPLGIMTELTNPETGVKEPMPLFFMALAFFVLAAVVAVLHRPKATEDQGAVASAGA